MSTTTISLQVTRGGSPALTDAERAMLDLEAHWPSHGPLKDAQIRSRLSMSTVRYYRALSTLLETERAIAYDPLLVARLRRARDRARVQRGVVRQRFPY